MNQQRQMRAAMAPPDQLHRADGKRRRGVPRAGEESSFCVIGVVVMDLIVTLGFIICVFLPCYHYTTIAFLTGATLNFEISLFRVWVTGNATGLSVLNTITFNAIQKFVTYCMDTLQNSSLAGMQNLACGVDTMFYQIVPTGCYTVSQLRIVSYVLIAFLVAAALFQGIGAFVLIYLWWKKRSQSVLRMVYFFHFTPALAVFPGLLIYIMIGGTNIQLTPNLGPLMSDVSVMDLGSGYFVCTGFGILSLVALMFLYFSIPKGLCYDSRRFQSNLRDEETEYLLGEIRQERMIAASHQQHFPVHQPLPVYPYPNQVVIR